MKINIITDNSSEGQEIMDIIYNLDIKDNINNKFTIRWGNFVSEECEGIEFNSKQSIKNSLDKENVILTLRRNKIRSPRRIKPSIKTDFPIIGRKYTHKNGTDIKIIDSFNEYKKSDSDYYIQYIKVTQEYRVHVMDLEVFFIEEKYKEDYIEGEEITIRTKAFGWNLRKVNLEDKDDKEKEEIFNISIKAIHALGLDYGVVNIGKDINGKYLVLDVDPTCKYMDEECKNAYVDKLIQTILKYDKLVDEKKEVTIGADPECLIKDKFTGELIVASELFKESGYFGLDDRSLEAQKKYFPIMEIRPDYSINPLKVFESIEQILISMYKHIHYKNVGIYSGSMPIYNYWIGGHIHFGIKPNSKLIKALDNYLALLVMMIENPYTARQRKTKYGMLGNYRLKYHGGFEYCSISSWLVSPELAKAVLCLAKVISQEYLNLNKIFLSTYSDIRAYYLVNKDYFKDKIKTIIEDIKSTKTFLKYKDQIQPLFQKALLSESWNEQVDIKDTWNLGSSDKEYKFSLKCFMPKEKRKEFNLKIKDKIEILIKDKKYKIEILPKDDVSQEKNGYVSFSKDICDELGIKTSDEVQIWFDENERSFKIGPILGIFAYIINHEFGPFGFQSYYFRKLMKLGKNKGMIVYVFTIWDINWENKTIKGYVYDFDEEKWIERYFCIPHVIYDRGDFVSEKNYGQLALDYINNIKENNIKLVNSMECINLTNDKLKTYEFLKKNYYLEEFLPETSQYNNKTLYDFVHRYKKVYIKLRDGSRSKGIFSIEKINDDVYLITHKNLYGYNIKITLDKDNLSRYIENKIKEFECSVDDYIIQQGLVFAKYDNKNFEIRVVMQKNSKGIWLRTCMVGRVAINNDKFLDSWDEKNIRSSKILKECFKENEDIVKDKMIKISKYVVDLIDNENIIAGEVAIDFGIDENLNVYIIELNSKPDNLLASIGAYKRRNIAINRILEYSKFLVQKTNSWS
ncbi:YheC/D like ATP-grasp [Alkalithermobacter thermoalcaliphilus JW-YL-7 = DSM 7308]|uniref:Phage phiEco32-like COOH-NH2 ligase-type 2 n=1 Tax=Alkalithermobacter thermoalcaliphilus JW-YL-7 = DSM 7308 TaxID=1121328 RepID=A0A150FP24_CLOPD|nr:Phage phiEco32-like COOH-NH2 ligase-type 2 [[Clostridium] paradoxum JW-YL-7 = DSM 7308]SHK53838.1 YheC/D like ATP-grasp [[Clostridium] paradoxum JW-YL-7 = DSM 7308]